MASVISSVPFIIMQIQCLRQWRAFPDVIFKAMGFRNLSPKGCRTRVVRFSPSILRSAVSFAKSRKRGSGWPKITVGFRQPKRQRRLPNRDWVIISAVIFDFFFMGRKGKGRVGGGGGGFLFSMQMMTVICKSYVILSGFFAVSENSVRSGFGNPTLAFKLPNPTWFLKFSFAHRFFIASGTMLHFLGFLSHLWIMMWFTLSVREKMLCPMDGIHIEIHRYTLI